MITSGLLGSAFADDTAPAPITEAAVEAASGPSPDASPSATATPKGAASGASAGAPAAKPSSPPSAASEEAVAAAPTPTTSSSATEEIPQATVVPFPPQVVDDPYPGPGSTAGQSAEVNHEIAGYRAAQGQPPVPSNVGSLHEFLSETSDLSPIGVELREETCRLSTGEQAEGLAIIGVRRGSPAANAGLHAYWGTTHSVLEGVTVIAALVFPPAILATALIDQTHVGESFDTIIAVDGKRVSSVVEFEDQMRDVRPGDIVYLTVVRDGARVQIPVKVPAGTNWPY